MCDILVANFSSEYRAPKTLHRFMVKSTQRGDLDGWGVGFFLRNRKAVVIKDAELGMRGELPRVFDLVARSIESEIIIAHFRLASRRDLYGTKYAHPFIDTFLNSDWIFAHNGYAPEILRYNTSGERIHLDPNFDSPFIFEFIRDKMVEYLDRHRAGSLYNAVRYAVKKLYDNYKDGTYNFVLANSNVVFFNLDGRHPHNNRLYLLYRKKRPRYEKAIIATTVPDLTDEEWIEIRPRDNFRGKLLMFSEGELLYHGDV